MDAPAWTGDDNREQGDIPLCIRCDKDARDGEVRNRWHYCRECLVDLQAAIADRLDRHFEDRDVDPL